ncbi:methylaspartate mutase subunit S [Pseudomaricurvus alkylphenolicus]|jgi:methylaspartate mutase sigma subunit|uniref:methylaspartate mutase subunit S n=1 Tax=Pseudomaricurvus alkylphenolicus TaxID=1306991 RepID=UPI001420F4C4|nr:methylaspartate mutase subunit S [Pseudomaricurvus alkylphenolicus]NIB42159.1 methylaspartate mutase subunit S [Pseudomaricurvus alkylphenolicus]
MQQSTSEPTVILGVIGADCHAVGNKIIMSVLSQLSFQVINLGVMVSQDEFIDAAIEHNAEAILVSSIYGHGEIDCAGLRERCMERGLAEIILYVGGNLVIGKRPFAEVQRLFAGMGYDRVFQPGIDLHDVAKLLRMDIHQRRQPQWNQWLVAGHREHGVLDMAARA